MEIKRTEVEDVLNEVRRIIFSNEEIMSLLNNARAQREKSRACARKVVLVNNQITRHQEGEMPKDGIVIEIAANGDEVNIGGIWIGIAKINPEDLDDVRKSVTSDFNTQLLLTQVRNRARTTK